MSSTSSYCKSANTVGEAGGDRGTGDGGSVGDSVVLNTISDSSASNTGSPCLFSRAASRLDFLQFAEETSQVEKNSLFCGFPLPVN